jgi:catechol 2,3-dioxygenase-like lactoylglutathione lyase family enzyme
MPPRLHHVQIAAPPGSEAAARAFYVGIVGMVETPKPAALAARGGIWLRFGEAELHIGIEPDFRPATKAHPAFEIDGLERLRAKLQREGARVQVDALLPGRDRFYTYDPFGNRLEFVGAEPA